MDPMLRLVSDEPVGAPPDDQPSFEGFFAEHAPVLFRRLCVITGNTSEAEEIMQDAFLGMWERWDRVRDLENPEGYLYRAAMNRFRNRYRRARMALRRLPHPAPPSEPFAEIDRQQDAVAALATLSPRQRAALVLLDVMDLPAEEAARMLGVGTGTVRGFASRARATLRERLGDER